MKTSDFLEKNEWKLSYYTNANVFVAFLLCIKNNYS